MEIYNLTDEQRQKIVKYASTKVYTYVRRKVARADLGSNTSSDKVRKLADTPKYAGVCLSVALIMHYALKTFDIDSKLLKINTILTNIWGIEHLLKHGHDSWFRQQLKDKAEKNLKELTGGNYIYTVSLGLAHHGVTDLHAALGFQDQSILDVTIQQMDRPQHKLHINPFWMDRKQEFPANIIKYEVENEIAYDEYVIAITKYKKIKTLIRRVCEELSPIIGRPYKSFKMV